MLSNFTTNTLASLCCESCIGGDEVPRLLANFLSFVKLAAASHRVTVQGLANNLSGKPSILSEGRSHFRKAKLKGFSQIKAVKGLFPDEKLRPRLF